MILIDRWLLLESKIRGENTYLETFQTVIAVLEIGRRNLGLNEYSKLSANIWKLV